MLFVLWEKILYSFREIFCHERFCEALFCVRGEKTTKSADDDKNYRSTSGTHIDLVLEINWKKCNPDRKKENWNKNKATILLPRSSSSKVLPLSCTIMQFLFFMAVNYGFRPHRAEAAVDPSHVMAVNSCSIRVLFSLARTGQGLILVSKSEEQWAGCLSSALVRLRRDSSSRWRRTPGAPSTGLGIWQINLKVTHFKFLAWFEWLPSQLNDLVG